MLQRVNIEIEEFQKDAQDIPILLKNYDLKDAYLFWESHQKAALMLYSDFSLADNLNEKSMRFVIFTDKLEIRLEKDPQNMLFYGRILQDINTDGIYRIKDDVFTLRKSRNIDSKIKKKILCREYFKPDDDGMLVFFADRLAVRC